MHPESRNIDDITPLAILSIVIMAFPMIFLSSCRIEVPIEPEVGKVEIKNPIPLEAGLLIAEETKNYVFRGRPESYMRGWVLHEFPLGRALKQASVQIFGQLFKKLAVIQTLEEAKHYRVVIEPKIDDFHFRYASSRLIFYFIGLSSSSFFSKIRIKVTLYNIGAKEWERVVESPEYKKGPWPVAYYGAVPPHWMGYSHAQLGESASEGLVFALTRLLCFASIELEVSAPGCRPH